MISLRIVVVAHTARRDAADHLAMIVDADRVFTDDGTLGPAGNHRRAWQWHTQQPHTANTWCVVLEDDAQPVTAFRDHLADALTSAPADIVSLYLGRTRPPHWQGRIRRATTEADQLDAAWITSTHLLHAVGIAARPHLTDTMADWTKHLAEPVDGRNVGQHTIAYTWPSIIDHAIWPSVITTHPDGKPRTTPRTAWRHGTRQRWNTTTVTMGHH